MNKTNRSTVSTIHPSIHPRYPKVELCYQYVVHDNDGSPLRSGLGPAAFVNTSTNSNSTSVGAALENIIPLHSKNASGLVAGVSESARYREAEVSRWIAITRCDQFHSVDGEGEPKNTRPEQLECLADLINSDGEIEIEDPMAVSHYEWLSCAERALDAVAICQGWTGFTLRFSKAVHRLCATRRWTGRRVLKTVELSFGTCDTTEYPDHTFVCQLLAWIGMAISALLVLVGKPLDVMIKRMMF